MNRREFIAGLSATPLVGVVAAQARPPLLMEAVIRFQNPATAELLPLAASFARTKEIVAANIMNGGRA